MFSIRAEKISSRSSPAHPAPHKHQDYYEFYFLLDGKRDFFIDHHLYSLEKGCMAVVAPNHYHKTEGSYYSRINVYVSPELFTDDEADILIKLVQDKAVVINKKYYGLIVELLNECVEIFFSSLTLKERQNYILQIFKTILVLLRLPSNTKILPASMGKTPELAKSSDSSEILRIVSYINENYMEKINLQILCDKFFISKTALNLKFREIMQCTVMDYLLSVRLQRAALLLTNTRRSIENIAAECGFSSANYFGLVYKKKMGIAPNKNRKKKKKPSSYI